MGIFDAVRYSLVKWHGNENPRVPHTKFWCSMARLLQRVDVSNTVLWCFPFKIWATRNPWRVCSGMSNLDETRSSLAAVQMRISISHGSPKWPTRAENKITYKSRWIVIGSVAIIVAYREQHHIHQSPENLQGEVARVAVPSTSWQLIALALSCWVVSKRILLHFLVSVDPLDSGWLGFQGAARKWSFS